MFEKILNIQFSAQNARHEELRSLYVRAEGILDKHRSESESVQAAAEMAKETSARARKQITDSLGKFLPVDFRWIGV